MKRQSAICVATVICVGCGFPNFSVGSGHPGYEQFREIDADEIPTQAVRRVVRAPIQYHTIFPLLPCASLQLHEGAYVCTVHFLFHLRSVGQPDFRVKIQRGLKGQTGRIREKEEAQIKIVMIRHFMIQMSG